MRSIGSSVKEYLENLPPDRRLALETVRRTILKNLPNGYEEAVDGGFICYQVPLPVYPDTYNKRPLMYAAVANQKNHMAVYMCNVYAIPALKKELEAGFKSAGKKLNMGKSCIRFKRLEDLALEAIGKAVAATPMKSFIAFAKTLQTKK